MATFEGHTKYMTKEPATQPFASRHSAKKTGAAVLPPGHDQFRKNSNTNAKTPKSYIKTIGD